jgi:hypothetical protein
MFSNECPSLLLAMGDLARLAFAKDAEASRAQSITVVSNERTYDEREKER